MNSRTNRLQYLLPRAFLHSFFLCLQFNNLKKLLLTLRSVFQKKHHKCCYRRTSSNVNTVKEICRWYRSQFNKFEKAWVRVEILYFDFRKTPSYQNIKSSKVVTFEICEIFSNYYLSYVRDYKATLVGGNKYFTTGDKIYKEISLIQHMSFDIHSCNKVKGWYTQSDE